ncbi:MAG TPA: four helix bundle protein [Ignavibacteriaceae bacterium]|nr:four helix bundle protein [Ignavibacteriaceae bacterium]
MIIYPDFTNMPVWQKSFDLGVLIYEITKEFPDDEKFGLISDMKRAVNSIIHNIAEGFGRYEKKDKTRFYKISRGSSYELMSQSILSFKLGFIKKEKILDDALSLSDEIIKELNALIKSIECK